jgi:proteic killer suppression protein
MIRSFRHRGLRRLYENDERRWIRADMILSVVQILTALDVAAAPRDMSLPRYRLHPLKGELEGLWAVTVRANWRITFRFHDGDVYDVDLVDYH